MKRMTQLGTNRPPAFLEPLLITQSRALWLSTALANSGRWVLVLGSGWLLFQLTHSSFWVGLSMFFIQAPALIVAPLTGVLADRYDRRVLLIDSLVVATLVLGVLTIATFFGFVSLPLVLGVVLMIGCVFSVQGVTSSALLPDTISRERLPNAVALLGAARQGAEFLGPLIATPLLGHISLGAVFLLAMACYLIAGQQAALLHVHPVRGATKSRRLYRPLLEGLRYVVGVPVLLSVIGLVAFHCLLTMTYQSMLPQFVATHLGRGNSSYGVLMTAIGFGAVLGSLSLAGFAHSRWLGPAYAVTALVSGLSLVVLGQSAFFSVALLGALLAGGTQAMFMSISLTFLQRETDDMYMGRVVGVYSFFASGAMAAAGWGLGILAGIVAPSILMTVCGLLFVAIVAVAGCVSPAFRMLALPILRSVIET